MSIILKLDELMREKNITVAELAKQVGISPVNLSPIKNGRVSSIRFNTLDGICKALNCQPGDLLKYELKEQDKKKIIPRFLDYTGTTDLLINGGAENVKKYFDSTIAIQQKTGCEIRDIMVTGSPLESAKSKLKHLSDLAENYGLPNLYDCAIAEYCGFAIRKDKSESLLPVNPNISESRSAIESIIGEYGGEINPNNISYYNVIFDTISRENLARVGEEIEKLMEEKTGDKSIEALTIYDDYGKECDIKPKNHTKSRAVLMVTEQLHDKYNIPLVIIGGDSQQEDLKMYTETKQTLSDYEIPSVFIAPSNIGEIERFDRNIIIGDWENSDGISHCMEQLTSKIKIKDDGGLEI